MKLDMGFQAVLCEFLKAQVKETSGGLGSAPLFHSHGHIFGPIRKIQTAQEVCVSDLI